MYNNFNLFYNDKVGVLSKAKIATRFLGTVLSDVETGLRLNTFGKSHEDSEASALREWSNMIDEKANKRDILLLYRSPYQRFLSATVEDVILGLQHFTNAYDGHLYFFPIEKHNIDIVQFISDLKNISDKRNKWEWKPNYRNCIADIVSSFIRYKMMINPFLSNHNELYTQTLYGIYSSFKDKSKVSLFNIEDTSDGTLKERILPYVETDKKVQDDKTPEAQHKHQTSNNMFKDVVDRVIRDNSLYTNYIDNALKNEIFYFEELEEIRRKIR